MKTAPISEKHVTFAWILLAALSIWLGFPNDLYSFPPAVVIWPVALAGIAAVAGSLREAFLYGWLATGLGMLAGLYWLSMPVAMVGGLAWPLAFLCALLIAVCLSLQGALFSGLAYCLRHCGIFLLALLLALSWYLLEYSFALLPAFPWLPIAAALAQWPLLIQSADIFGAYFTGALWLFSALLCFNPLKPRISSGLRALSVATGAILLSVMIWYGAYQLLGTDHSDDAIVNTIMVEGNIDQNQKWTPPFQKKSLAIYLNLTSEALAKAAAIGIKEPLIVWPETAMPFFYETNAYLGGELAEAVREWKHPLLFGAPGVSGQPLDEVVFNRAFLLGPDGKTLGKYDKVHLVPFGEYLPEWLKFDFLEELLQGVGIYAAGDSIKSLNYGPLALGVLICYEAIFPWLARDRVAGGANILVDISNDGWFGRTPAARQHLYLAVLRCVEQNRWLLRATNTGISAVADNRGRIVFTGPMFKEGYLLCRGRLIAGRSIFYYAGNWLPCLAVLLVAAGLWHASNSRPGSNVSF